MTRTIDLAVNLLVMIVISKRILIFERKLLFLVRLWRLFPCISARAFFWTILACLIRSLVHILTHLSRVLLSSSFIQKFPLFIVLLSFSGLLIIPILFFRLILTLPKIVFMAILTGRLFEISVVRGIVFSRIRLGFLFICTYDGSLPSIEVFIVWGLFTSSIRRIILAIIFTCRIRKHKPLCILIVHFLLIIQMKNIVLTLIS